MEGLKDNRRLQGKEIKDADDVGQPPSGGNNDEDDDDDESKKKPPPNPGEIEPLVISPWMTTTPQLTSWAIRYLNAQKSMQGRMTHHHHLVPLGEQAYRTEPMKSVHQGG